MAENIGFAAQMEELFEEDLSNAREVRLAGSAAHPRVRPERPIQSSDREARRDVVGSGSGGSATILRVGSSALQKSGYPLETHEQALAAAASGALLGASLLGLRFPRFLAWPLAAVGVLYGGLGVLRAARSAISERVSTLRPQRPSLVSTSAAPPCQLGLSRAKADMLTSARGGAC